MQDRIPRRNGKNNNIKIDLTGITTWQDFVEANEAGILKADVFINRTSGEGAIVQGTPLTKANLLKDSTAALVGLEASATVDDALREAINEANNKNSTSNELDDFQMESGTANVSGSTTTIEFNRGFNGTPTIFASAITPGVGSTPCFCQIYSVTPENFSIRVFKLSITGGAISYTSANCKINYLAVYDGGNDE